MDPLKGATLTDLTMAAMTNGRPADLDDKPKGRGNIAGIIPADEFGRLEREPDKHVLLSSTAPSLLLEIEEPDFLTGVKACSIQDPTCEACQ